MSDSAPKKRLPRTGTLLLIAVVLVVVGGVMMVWLPYHREQRAIAEIEKVVGLGGLSEETEIKTVRPSGIPDPTGDEFWRIFKRVTNADLSYSPIGDTDLRHLSGLSNLNSLSVDHTQVGDEGMKHLQELTKLEKLSIEYTQVTDIGLERLRGLTNLERLNLRHTQVTKEGVERLEKALPDCVIIWGALWQDEAPSPD